MKRFACSLIGFSLLWFAILGFQPDNLQQDHFYAGWSGWEQTVSIITPAALAAYPLAGWILTGNLTPKEPWPSRLILSFGFAVAGIIASFLALSGAVWLGNWMIPPPQPEYQ